MSLHITFKSCCNDLEPLSRPIQRILSMALQFPIFKAVSVYKGLVIIYGRGVGVK